MRIPHVDRTITHVDRTVVAAPPASVFRRLTALADLVAASDAVRLESWPDDGLHAPDAAFWAVHWAAPSSGHAVEYRLVEVSPPTCLELQASSDLYDAVHRVVVAPATGGGSEIAWAVTLDPDRPTTRQLVEDASLLGATALCCLDQLDAERAEDDVIELAVDDVIVLDGDEPVDITPDDSVEIQSYS